MCSMQSDARDDGGACARDANGVRDESGARDTLASCASARVMLMCSMSCFVMPGIPRAADAI